MASTVETRGAGELAMFLRLWEESWGVGIWCGPWAKAVGDLTPEQAAWSPGGALHSIWQNVAHVCVWREYTLTKVDGRPGPKRDQMDGLNFQGPRAGPSAATEAEWKALVARLKQTHMDMADAMKKLGAAGAGPLERGSAAERLAYHLGHDIYHLGQIMHVRAALGLKPLE